MSIGLLDTLSRDPRLPEREAGAAAGVTYQIGATFELQVLERIDSRLYRVLLGAPPHYSARTLQSSTELTPGSTLSVRIAAAGERLVMHSADPRVAAVALQEASALEPRVADLLAKQARRHLIRLDDAEAALVEGAMRQVEEPQAMAAAGLFLAKLGLPLDPLALHAVYEALVWRGVASSPAASSHLARLDDAEQLSAALLEHLAKDDLGASPVGADAALLEEPQMPARELAPGQHDADRQARQQLAQHLLNTQDDVATSYQYGTLPLLIADQLVELDVVCFHSPTPAVPSGLRRLTMTFNSRTLGRIEVKAQSLGTALVLNLRAAAAPSEVLAAHAEDLRALAARLGWQVESLSYEHAQSPRAATQLVQHVLNADTLDRLL